ncbi:MAG: Zn-ribbon domain-containing OB-fold protein [Deltaproteobacteria bacterium]|nr:Zn-ribbon domain-containing OB-fold protein [Deltaproteobacteria bacterium]
MEPKNTRGRDLNKKEFDGADKIQYKLKAEYAYDSGYAVGKYLQGLKEGKLLGVHCRKCGRTLIPPRAFCELCFVPIVEWVELQDTGRVNTFSISYVKWDASRIETPELPAVIEIEGASPNCGILHMLGEVNPQDIRIGMRVRAVWKPAAERTGAITDIKYFKPMK